MTTATVNLPAALVKVLGPARGSYQYRVLRGGRGSGKSVGAATIAELQHVGQASSKLHRTQPALTSAVRRLEEDCKSRCSKERAAGFASPPQARCF